MLPRVETIHTPKNVDEAINLLMEPDTRPLYGGVALHRESPTSVKAVVDLSNLALKESRVFDAGFSLGSMLTLEEARLKCLELGDEIPNARFLADIIRQDVPITLRNTMTLGDALVERKTNSLLLTALVALDAQIDANGWPRFIHDWLNAPEIEVRSALITAVALEKGDPLARYAYEKVARTPADDPIVGAIVYACRDDTGQLVDVRLAMCGVDSHPIPLAAVDETLIASNGDIEAALAKLQLNPPGDHWGSSEYRAAMARVLGQRVLEQVLIVSN